MVARMVVEAVHHLLNYTFLSTKSQVFSIFRLGKQRWTALCTRYFPSICWS